MPLLGQLLPLFSSRLIRNRATLGGNLMTASPIGDGPPVLLALDASVTLASAAGRRVVPLREFFLAYRKTAARPGEVLIDVRVPRGAPAIQRFYKVSKRILDDISTVAAAFALDLTPDGRVARARIAYGGIAATPIRATALEDGAGRPAVDAARRSTALRSIADGVGTPMTDLRGSAAYRRAMVGRLLEKCVADTAPAGEPVGRAMNQPVGADRRRAPRRRCERCRTNRRSATSPARRATSTTCGPTSRTSRTRGRCRRRTRTRVSCRIDAAAARERTGVLAVLTADDVPGENDTGPSRDTTSRCSRPRSASPARPSRG